MVRKSFILSAAGLAVAVGAGTAFADVTVNGVNIANDFGDFSSGFDIGNTFDQSGLTDNYVSGLTDFESFSASTDSVGNGNQNDTWFGVQGAPVPGNIDFDLGAEWTVTQLALWSFTPNDANAFDGFEVFVDDNPAFSSPTFAGSFTFINSNAVSSRPSQVFDLTDTVGQYVRLRLIDQDTDYVAMGEILFGAEPIPAPGAALLGIMGLSLVGSRRRRGA